MFLSKILKNKKIQNKQKILLLKKLYFKILLLKSIFNNFKLYSKLLNTYKNSNNNLNKLINYILIINMSPTNTLVNLTDPQGKLLISLSAGQLGLKGKQKRKQPSVLILLLKELLIKTRFIKNQAITLHFKNTKSYHESLVISMLSEKFFIQLVKSYNLLPHNGCRPKKLKRLKNKS